MSRSFETFEANRNVKYKNLQYRRNIGRYVDAKIVSKLYSLAIECKIKSYRLIYKDKIIGLLKNLTVSEACDFLNINKENRVEQYF